MTRVQSLLVTIWYIKLRAIPNHSNTVKRRLSELSNYSEQSDALLCFSFGIFQNFSADSLKKVEKIIHFFKKNTVF